MIEKIPLFLHKKQVYKFSCLFKTLEERYSKIEGEKFFLKNRPCALSNFQKCHKVGINLIRRRFYTHLAKLVFSASFESNRTWPFLPFSTWNTRTLFLRGILQKMAKSKIFKSNQDSGQGGVFTPTLRSKFHFQTDWRPLEPFFFFFGKNEEINKNVGVGIRINRISSKWAHCLPMEFFYLLYRLFVFVILITSRVICH